MGFTCNDPAGDDHTDSSLNSAIHLLLLLVCHFGDSRKYIRQLFTANKDVKKNPTLCYIYSIEHGGFILCY